jgi:hypothetical protein
VVTTPKDPQVGPRGRLSKRGTREPLPTERPPGAPLDPWTVFATTPERPPGLIRRGTRAFFRSFIHEYALAIYGGLLLAVALTWPTLRYPLHTLPEDLGDPARQAWQVSWLGHILLTHPQQLWQSNAFYPEPNSLAFGDSLLGYAPVGMLGDGPLAATLRYNILFVLAHALLAVGGYALVRQLGAGRTGAAVAAVAIAYAPWRLAQEGHLDIISAGGIPLALAMLARGHGWSLRRGHRPNERNAGWAALGWLVAAWQVSLGFSLGLPFLGVLGLIVLVLLVGTPVVWSRRRSRRRAHVLQSAADQAALTPGPAGPPGNAPAADQLAGSGATGSPPAGQASNSIAVGPSANQAASISNQPPKGQSAGGQPISGQPVTGQPVSGQMAPSQPADGQPSAVEDAAQRADNKNAAVRPGDSQNPVAQAGDSKDVRAEPAGGSPEGKTTDGMTTEGEALEGKIAGDNTARQVTEAKTGGEVTGDKTGGEVTGDKTAGEVVGRKTDRHQAGRRLMGWPLAGRRSGGERSGGRRRAVKVRAAARERDFLPVLGWRLLIIDALGPLILAGIAALIALPYFHLADKSNSTAEIKFFSPPLWSLLIGPSESRVWGGPHQVARSALGWPAEMSLLPGFVLYALALAGLWFSVWKFRQRLVLIVALAASIVLTLGTNFFGGHWTYLPLFGHLPASLGQRIPGRMMLWVTLLLGILAAGAVAEFVRRAEHWSAQRIPPWPAWWLRLATLVPLLLVIAEGWNTTAHPVVPAQPASMRTIISPMLVLPTGAVTDGTVMLWSTSRYQKIANGSGGFAAARQAQMRTAVAGFPDAASIQYLRSINVTTVLLVRSAVAGTPWERAGDTPVDSLGITREDAADAVIFHLGQ